MDGVVHFEIPTDDLAKAQEFYSSVFGWQTRTLEQVDHMLGVPSIDDALKRLWETAG